MGRGSPGDKASLRRQAEERLRGKTKRTALTRRPDPDPDPKRLRHDLEVHQVELEMQNEELRRTQGDLEKALACYTDFYDFTPAGYLTLKMDSSIQQINLTVAKLLGIERAHLLKRQFVMFIAAADRPAFTVLLARAFQNKAPEVGEVRLSIEGKPPVTVQLHAYVPVSGKECRVVLTDITERKQMEEALRQSEMKYRRLYQSMRDAFAGVDMEGRLQEFNQAYAEMLGYTEAKLRSMSYQDLTPAKWHAMEAEILRTQVLPRGYSDIYEKEYRRQDGTIFPVELRTFLLRDDAGQPVGMWAIVRDTTARKKTQAALRRSQQRLALHIQQTPLAVIEYDLDGRIQEWNPAAVAMFGFSRGEAIGQHWTFLVPESIRGSIEGVWAAVAKCRGGNRSTNTNRTRDGRIISCEWFNTTLTDPQGQAIGVASLVMDITERQQAQEALRASEEALHELSGRLLQVQDEERRRIARELHDTVAQSLAALSLNLGLLETTATALDPDAQKFLADSQALADQCGKELRTASYLLYPPILDQLGLAGAVRDHADGFAHRTGLRVDLELPPDLVRLPRDTELALFRVLQEALTNVQHHSGSKTASIRVTQTAEEIRLEVRDQGRETHSARGLPARFEQLMFAGPPERLSDAQSGLAARGLGIPGMKERMRQLGGRLEIQSEAHGTLVIAIVPRRQETSRA